MPRYSDVKSTAQDQHIPFIFDNILLVFKVNLYVNRKKLNINMCVSEGIFKYRVHVHSGLCLIPYCHYQPSQLAA